MVSVVIFSLSLMILSIWALTIFLHESAKSLLILFVFSKNQILVSLVFLLLFLDPILFISTLHYFLFLCSLWTVFVVSFLVPLGIRSDYLLEIFLVFEVGLYCCEFSS